MINSHKPLFVILVYFGQVTDFYHNDFFSDILLLPYKLLYFAPYPRRERFSHDHILNFEYFIDITKTKQGGQAGNRLILFDNRSFPKKEITVESSTRFLGFDCGSLLFTPLQGLNPLTPFSFHSKPFCPFC